MEQIKSSPMPILFKPLSVKISKGAPRQGEACVQSLRKQGPHSVVSQPQSSLRWQIQVANVWVCGPNITKTVWLSKHWRCKTQMGATHVILDFLIPTFLKRGKTRNRWTWVGIIFSETQSLKYTMMSTYNQYEQYVLFVILVSEIWYLCTSCTSPLEVTPAQGLCGHLCLVAAVLGSKDVESKPIFCLRGNRPNVLRLLLHKWQKQRERPHQQSQGATAVTATHGNHSQWWLGAVWG